jgi:hypothetical protein
MFFAMHHLSEAILIRECRAAGKAPRSLLARRQRDHISRFVVRTTRLYHLLRQRVNH